MKKRLLVIGILSGIILTITSIISAVSFYGLPLSTIPYIFLQTTFLILLILFFEYFLFSKTQEKFLYKIYLILFLFLAIEIIYFQWIISLPRGDYDGIGGSAVMAGFAFVELVVFVLIFLRILLQQIFREFFQKKQKIIFTFIYRKFRLMVYFLCLAIFILSSLLFIKPMIEGERLKLARLMSDDKSLSLFYMDIDNIEDLPILKILEHSYLKDKINVYEGYKNPKKVEGADPNTFEVIENSPKEDIYTSGNYNNFYFPYKQAFGRDKNHVYKNLGFVVVPIENVDGASFEILPYLYSKDKNHVYYGLHYSLPSENPLMKDADVKTFEVLGAFIGYDESGDWQESIYARDENNFYCRSEWSLEKFDPDKITVLEDGYVIEGDNRIYRGCKPEKNKSNNEVVDKNSLSDDDRYFLAVEKSQRNRNKNTNLRITIDGEPPIKTFLQNTVKQEIDTNLINNSDQKSKKIKVHKIENGDDENDNFQKSFKKEELKKQDIDTKDISTNDSPNKSLFNGVSLEKLKRVNNSIVSVNQLYNTDGVDLNIVKSMTPAYRINEITNQIFFGSINVNMPLKNVDIDSFVILGEIHAKDKKYVYHGFTTIEGADPTTFEIIEGDYARDRNTIFWKDRAIKGIDKDSFEILDKEHSKDKHNLFAGNWPLKNLDPSSIEILSPIFVKTKDGVYFSSKLARSIDGNTFEVINESYGKDKRSFYSHSSIIADVDFETFTPLNKSYAKDKNTIYHGRFPMSKADLASFEVLDSAYAKDKNHAYYLEMNIKNADPKTFRPMGGLYARDKNNFYMGYSIITEDDFTDFAILKELK